MTSSGSVPYSPLPRFSCRNVPRATAAFAISTFSSSLVLNACAGRYPVPGRRYVTLFSSTFHNPRVSCAAGLSLRLAAVTESGADVFVAHQSALLLETDLQLVDHGPVGVAEGLLLAPHSSRTANRSSCIGSSSSEPFVLVSPVCLPTWERWMLMMRRFHVEVFPAEAEDLADS
jgi:hypothetical protein